MLSRMSVDTPEQLEGLKRVGRLVASTLRSLRVAVAPGVTTGELDAFAAEAFAASGAPSGPILTYGYPASICVCVDDEIVHAIPGQRRLHAGQLVTLDVAAELDGYHADAATTIPVGAADRLALRLLEATRASLIAGIRAAQPGARLGDVGAAIERTANARGLRGLQRTVRSRYRAPDARAANRVQLARAAGKSATHIWARVHG